MSVVVFIVGTMAIAAVLMFAFSAGLVLLVELLARMGVIR